MILGPSILLKMGKWNVLFAHMLCVQKVPLIRTLPFDELNNLYKITKYPCSTCFGQDIVVNQYLDMTRMMALYILCGFILLLHQNDRVL